MQEKGVKIVEAEMRPDHVCMLAEIPPSICAAHFVGVEGEKYVDDFRTTCSSLIQVRE